MTEEREAKATLLTSKYWEVHEEAVGKVRELIREDLDDPANTESEPEGTRYAERACKFAGRFTGPGAFQLADQLFDVILQEIAEHPSGQTRHLGLPMHEQAICKILLGDYDEAVPRLIMVAGSATPDEAQRTLQMNFVERTCELAARSAAAFLDPAVSGMTRNSVERAIEPFGERKWAFLGAVSSLHANGRTYRKWPTEYGQARLLDGLRAVAASLEGFVGAIGRGSSKAPIAAEFQQARRVTLMWGAERLFRSSPWWSIFGALESLTRFDAASADSDFRAKLSQIFARPMKSTEDATAISLALAGLVRNYAAHSVMISGSVAGQFNQIAGGLYSALALLFKAAEREGHLSHNE